uniref:Centriolar and ciliogenesis-associated protein HYLS1 C-terminal domain-containing protein n=1 Tax=Panagrolaimus superbus TaxID=310955 RepID=A0A914YIT1_9BILA
MDYTNDEIEETLSGMGYVADNDAIEEIRRELLSCDINNDDSVFDILDPFLEVLEEGCKKQPPQEVYDKYPHIQELIEYGQQSLQHLYHEMHDLDEEIAVALDDCDPELREILIRNLNMQEEQTKNYHFSETLSDIYEEEEEPSPRNNQKKLPSKDNSVPKQDRFQPTKTLPGFEFDEENRPITLERKTEQALISEVLKQKGAVRVNCPPPGKAPFKYDPVKRNAQYREAWKKFPVPGERRRASLRWKIRDIMIGRDIPHLKLIPNPGFVPRPDWNE